MPDPVDAILQAMRELAVTRVLVGIPQEKDERQDGAPLGNAAIGYIQHVGAPEINLPARPWLDISAAEEDMANGMENAGRAALAGDMVLAELTLNTVGLAGRNALIASISSNIPPPLKPATIRARRRRSKGSTYRRIATTETDVRTLVDTGQLRASVTYAIRKTQS